MGTTKHKKDGNRNETNIKERKFNIRISIKINPRWKFVSLISLSVPVHCNIN
jgi:hypothetical protein